MPGSKRARAHAYWSASRPRRSNQQFPDIGKAEFAGRQMVGNRIVAGLEAFSNWVDHDHHPSNGLVVRDARRCRAPLHEGL